jgi:hypothetical protein
LKILLAVVLACLVGVFAVEAQTADIMITHAKPMPVVGVFTRPKQTRFHLARESANTSRLESPLRGGNLCLAVEDAIALGPLRTTSILPFNATGRSSPVRSRAAPGAAASTVVSASTTPITTLLISLFRSPPSRLTSMGLLECMHS